MAALAAEDDSQTKVPVEGLVFCTKFQGKLLELAPFASTNRIRDLKRLLEEETAVPCTRQKLIGLVKGKLPPDETLLSELVQGMKGPPYPFTLMGTPDDKLFIDPSDRDDLPEVFDDFALDYEAEATRWHRSKRNARKLAEFTAKTEVNWISPRRPGKALLVLDLDHTILDFSRHDELPAVQAKRPGMDHFLTQCHRHYDIVIWSATHWRWLEVKLTELGMLTHPNYKICFVLDKSSMFRIISEKPNGEEFKHSVKPLRLLWDKFPESWGPSNTLHVDDLARNFALNPPNGVKCAPYYRDKSSGLQGDGADAELALLACYLCHVASTPPAGSQAGPQAGRQAGTQQAGGKEVDLLKWDHSKWRESALGLALASAQEVANQRAQQPPAPPP
mmetsp:Transcript_53909/g.122871  ORF Transcript_53909/g.122871 Transcript_53909/m.122871 type:complete len:390 (+) Transcript_53909:34-1203(+)